MREQKCLRLIPDSDIFEFWPETRRFPDCCPIWTGTCTDQLFINTWRWEIYVGIPDFYSVNINNSFVILNVSALAPTIFFIAVSPVKGVVISCSFFQILVHLQFLSQCPSPEVIVSPGFIRFVCYRQESYKLVLSFPRLWLHQDGSTKHVPAGVGAVETFYTSIDLGFKFLRLLM